MFQCFIVYISINIFFFYNLKFEIHFITYNKIIIKLFSSCLDRRRQRGGNASNICTILGVLGAKPSYFGTIANSIERR